MFKIEGFTILTLTRFSLITFSIATTINAGVTLFYLHKRRANYKRILMANIIWSLAWFGLFVYGVFDNRMYAFTGCARHPQSSSGCSTNNLSFAAFIFSIAEM